MKKIVLLILFFVSLFLYSQKISYAFSEDNLRPTPPPRLPVTDYDTGVHRVVDVMYLSYEYDDFTLDGFGLGFNYVNNYDDLAYNLGVGYIYLYGGPSSIWIDNHNLMFNGNLGYRLHGNSNTNNLMIFGGIHFMYIWVDVDILTTDNSIYAYGPAYGPLIGLKGEIKATPAVSIIPYLIIHHTMFDLTVEYNGNAYSPSIDPVTSVIMGFDVKFRQYSIGALLDMINNNEGSKILIMFSYDFDYNPGAQVSEEIIIPGKQRDMRLAGGQIDRR